MTDRIATLTVVLTEDMRDDDVRDVINAILQNRYVTDVTVGQPVNSNDYIARVRAKQELLGQIIDLFA